MNMPYRLLADLTVLLHFAFLVFVVAGALLARRHRAWLVAHLLAVAWGVYVEASGRLCPLTAVENRLRQRAGEAGYSGGFIEHYLLPIIYPEGLTRNGQIALAVLVVALNVVLYARILWRRHDRAAPDEHEV
jgi:hypothetical protein